MAEVIVSAVAERLTDMVVEQICDEINLVTGVEKEVLSLSDDLKNVQKLLDDAERTGYNSGSVRDWLRRLEYATYEMDDVLDEWNIALIKFRMQQANAPSQETKVYPCIPHSSCLNFKKIVTHHDIALKIKHVKARLDMILKERSENEFFENQGVSHSLERVTISFVEIDDIKGREIDKNNLVNKITSGSTSSNQGDHIARIHISSIVGTGGIGKTTLAQLVYNDQLVKDCFPLRIWVRVSDPFDGPSIAKEIVEKVQGSAPSTGTLDRLLELVKESISGKKFLLVLDDVWNGDEAKWGPLKNSLKSSCVAGSRILVTTRNEMVARNIGTNENEIHHLEQLSDDECWSLLSHIAFFEKSEVLKKGLLDIGRGIAKNCRGLPLAVKMLGSLLRFKNTVEEWEDILYSEMWQFERTNMDLFPHLLLCYNDLSPAQKCCFSYCALFPKNHEIDVDDLIRKWMALGYLSSSGGNANELELRGREYFDILANRCLFQNFQKHHFSENVISTCKMHDLVQDFAQWLRKEDYFESNEEASSCKTCSPFLSPVIVYRSLILKDNKEFDLHVCDFLARARVLDCRGFRNISMEIKKFIHLRNLSFDAVKVNEDDIKPICMLYTLQSLVLSRCWLGEIPNEIGNLSQLRHLDLSKSKVLKELPDNIRNLHELRSLDVSDCGLREIPSKIGNLSQLKYLDLSKNKELKELPESIWDLHELRSLNVSYCGLKEIPSEVGNLSQLRQLDLSKNKELKELPESIRDLHELRSLKVSYCGLKEIPSEVGNLSQLRLLDLSKNEELKQLPESTSNLHELRNLYVHECKHHFQLPQGLAKLNSLQITLNEFYGGGDGNKLRLLNKLNELSRSLLLLIKLVDEDDDIIEQAREAELRKKMHIHELIISFQDNMDEENKEEEVTMRRRFDVVDVLEPPPNLQSLTVEDYKGSRLPEWIASPSFHQLRQIELYKCDMCLSLPHLGKLPCLEELKIARFKKVELVGREFLGITSSSSSSIGFPKLKKLVFWTFSKWKEWEDITAEEEESAAVSVMPSLMELYIFYCPNLSALPHRLLRRASSLEKLFIYHSPQLEEAYKEKGGPLNKFISHIPNVYVWTL